MRLLAAGWLGMTMKGGLAICHFQFSIFRR